MSQSIQDRIATLEDTVTSLRMQLRHLQELLLISLDAQAVKNSLDRQLTAFRRNTFRKNVIIDLEENEKTP